VSERRLALLFAVSTYDHEDQFHPLAAPQGDAKALAGVLGDQSLGMFEVEVVCDPTQQQAMARLDELLSECRSGDFVLVHFACHGVKADGGKLYLAARDTKRQRLESTGIAAARLVSMMRSSYARKIVLFLDCCYSGAIGADAVPRGRDDADLDQLLTADGLKDSRGLAMITASSSTEQAYEVPGPLPGSTTSLFTQALVEGIRTGNADKDQDGMVTLDELYEYVRDQVREARRDQSPEVSLYNVQGNFVIAMNPRRRRRPTIEVIWDLLMKVLEQGSDTAAQAGEAAGPHSRLSGRAAAAPDGDAVPITSGTSHPGMVRQRLPGPPARPVLSLMPFLRDAVRIVSTAEGNPLGRIGLMAVAIVMAAQWGEYEQAQDWLQVTTWLPGVISDPVQRAAAQAMHAWALGECGDRMAAGGLARRARDTISRIAPTDERAAQALVRVLVEWVSCRQGSAEGVMRLPGAMAGIADQLPGPLAKSAYLAGLAWTWYLTGSVEQREIARLVDGEAEGEHATTSTASGVLSLLLTAWVAGQVAEDEKARELLTEIEQQARGVRHPDIRCTLLSIAAVAAAQAGDVALTGRLRRAATSVRAAGGLMGRGLTLAARVRDTTSKGKHAAAKERKEGRWEFRHTWTLSISHESDDGNRDNNKDEELSLNDLGIMLSVFLGMRAVRVLALLAQAWAISAEGDPVPAALLIDRAARLIRTIKHDGSRLLMIGIAACAAHAVGDSQHASRLVTELLSESDKVAARSRQSTVESGESAAESGDPVAEAWRKVLSQAYLLPAAWFRARRDGPAMASVAAATVTAVVNLVSEHPRRDNDVEYALALCTGVAWAIIWTGSREQAIELLEVIETAPPPGEDDLAANITQYAAMAWVAAQATDQERALRLAAWLGVLATKADGEVGTAEDGDLVWRGAGLIAAAWVAYAGERRPYQEVVRLLSAILPPGWVSGPLVPLRDSWIALFRRIALGSSG
jgi:hypothetical protein